MKKIQNSYKKSGVNISLANKFVKHIHKLSNKVGKKTKNSIYKDNIGGFGSLYDISNIDIKDPCSICANSKREKSTICIIEDVSDLWTIEKLGFYHGFYHVLGGTLSAIQGIGTDELKLQQLIEILDGCLTKNNSIHILNTLHPMYNKILTNSYTNKAIYLNVINSLKFNELSQNVEKIILLSNILAENLVIFVLILELL